MRIWSALLITAISLAAGRAAYGMPDRIGRIWELAQQGMAEKLPPLEELKNKCGADAVCAAQRIIDAEPRARLQRVPAPDTDRIRLQKRTSSVTHAEWRAGRRHIRLNYFGRNVREELRHALLPVAIKAGVPEVVLDLRCNGGGDVERMLSAAGLFTGPVEQALIAKADGASRPLPITSDTPPIFSGRLTVRIGPDTASSGEALAALLKKFANARLIGTRTQGKSYSQQVIPVSQRWHLLFPQANLRVPGIDWQNGLVPDVPRSEAEAACPRSSA